MNLIYLIYIKKKKWYQEKYLLSYFIFYFYIYPNLSLYISNLHNNIVIVIENNL